MKEQLKDLIITNIEKWTATDIYAISLYVYDDNDNPCKPTVTLGYNTEEQFQIALNKTKYEKEARWNYAFWIQNEFFRFGVNDTEEIVKKWILDNGLPYFEEDDPIWHDDIDYAVDEAEKVTKAFVDSLVCIVIEIHDQKILTKKFGKEIPIIIHELEYYDEIAEQNIVANGRELLGDFLSFCEYGY